MPKNFDRFVDQHGATGARPVRLATMTYEELAPNFRSVNEKNLALNRHLMANVEMPFYNGLEIDGGQHGQSTATMLINFGTMSDMSPVLQEALLQENHLMGEDERIEDKTINGVAATAPDSGHSGNTEGGKPVHLEVTPDRTAGTVKITPVIDMAALARANFNERNAARKGDKDGKFAGAPALNDSQADRLKVSVRYLTTTNGIGSMNDKRATENVAKAASQSYLMTASKSNPGRDMFSQSQIEEVSSKIAKVYSDFLHEYAEKKSDGLHPALRDKNGAVKPGKLDTSKVIDKTDFPSLKDMGLGVVDVNGSTVLAAIDLGDDSKNRAAAEQRHKYLPNVANAINATLSREFNSVPTMSSADIKKMDAGAERDAAQAALNTKNLGLAMKMNMFMTTPQSVETPFSVVQPAMTLTFSPFASMVRDTVECAQHKHDGPDGPAPRDGSERLKNTIEDVYGAEVLKNAKTILANAGLETDPKALAKKDPSSPDHIRTVNEAKAATQQFAADVRTAAADQLGVQLLNERGITD